MRALAILALVACGRASPVPESSPPPSPTPAADGGIPARFTELDAFVAARVAGGHIPGAVVLIAQRGAVVHERAFGVIDRGASEPMTVDALFDLESITKVVTAATALALADAHVLALADPVVRWLPDFANRTITVEELLLHTSGLPLDIADAPPDPELAWRAMTAAPLEIPPRTRVHYSDLGYRLLGRVLEAAGGAPLDRLVGTRVLEPLGLRDTMYVPPAALRPRIAGTGTSPTRGRLRGAMTDELDARLGGIVGCDGLFATARDVAKLAQLALAHGAPLVAPALGARMATAQTPAGAAPADWWDAIVRGPKTIGWEVVTPHAYGAAFPGGFCKAGIAGTFACADPARELVAVYLTNLGSPATAGLDLAGWYAALAPDRVFELAASSSSPWAASASP